MNIENLSELFVPVNKHGSQSTEVVKRIDELFASDAQVLTFPAGLVSRRNKGVIRDQVWKKTFIKKAIRYQRDIIPVHVSGRCTGFFYNLANIRRFLGVKYNLEMFFLPDETFRHRNKHVVIRIGKPVPWETFDNRNSSAEWALIMQDFVYTLLSDHNKSFEDFLN